MAPLSVTATAPSLPLPNLSPARWLTAGLLALSLGGVVPAAAAVPAAAGGPAAASGPAKPAVQAKPDEPLPEAQFTAALASSDPAQLAGLCHQTVAQGDRSRLRRLQVRLLSLDPRPGQLKPVLSQAEALLQCRAPEAALQVLDRFGPGPGEGRTRWLLLQWRAAHAAMDHRIAALALERLAGLNTLNLQALALDLRSRQDGTPVRRPALDQLANHLEAIGRGSEAGSLLLAATPADSAGAERRRRAVELLGDLPAGERIRLLDAALDQAAAAGHWSLAADLLDLQVALGSEQARQRRQRLSPRLDDLYGSWQLLQSDPGASSRQLESLQERLRSPRQEGGHADAPFAPAATVPALPEPAAPAGRPPSSQSTSAPQP
ncbi:MAG: hypothetical protein VKI83_09145 [Synechococcaceae cyanobacterium]|nr:hypothetical protein [Synechococcaceae cyanobacterium]